MKLLDRLKAEETKFGKWLKTWATYGLLILAGLDACLEWAQALPEGWLPPEIKIILIIASIITRVAGHLSVDTTKLKKDDQA